MGLMMLLGKWFGKGKSGADGNGGTQVLEGTQLMCVECNKTFLFETGEQKFYKMRGLTPPKRCTACRRQKKRFRRR